MEESESTEPFVESAKGSNQLLSLSERLLLARRRRFLTLGKLSKLTGVPVSSLSDYERGEAVPSADVIAKVAQAVDLSADWLLGLKDRPEPLWPREPPPEDRATPS